MKYCGRMINRVLLAGLCLLVAPTVHAAVPVIATEGDFRLDAARFPAALKEQVALVNTKCTTCHSLTRVVEALDTGRTASGAPFDKQYLKSLIIKKKRNPAASFSAEEARTLLQFLGYIQDNFVQYARK